MPIDYDAIRDKNIKKYGTAIDEYGPVLLANLYSDQTHFIYELLQNAEDAEATEVRFRLYDDRLELEHDGRPFNEADVRGNCGLVAGTKRNDITKIGKFGIGFKSVYAHTSSPEVHSADEHLAIDNYVQPRLTSARSTELGTHFVFPFNRAGKRPEESKKLIAKRLKDLGTRIMLFLRNINEISIKLEDGYSGIYLRQIDNNFDMDFVKRVAVIGESPDYETEEKWLVFEKNVAPPVDKELQIADDSVLTVQIAFLVSEYEQNGKPNIIKLSRSHLNVFFPTEKETKLGFLVQGPYKTTPARDNIPQTDPFNISLAKETGELVVEALRWLRDRDWLTVDVFATMPLAYIGRDRYEYSDTEHNQYKNTLFAPVYESVKRAISLRDRVKMLAEHPRANRLRSSELEIALVETPFLLAKNAIGDSDFRKPAEIYLRSAELDMYFEGNREAWFLSPI